MKTYFSLVLALFLGIFSQSFADVGPVGRSVEMDIDGTVKTGTEENVFRNVFNASGSALSAGQAVVFNSLYHNGASVKLSTTQTDNPACIITQACAIGAVCEKCQTYGVVNVLFDAAGGAAVSQDKVYLSSANAGKVSADSSPAAKDSPLGFFYEANAATDEVTMFVDLR